MMAGLVGRGLPGGEREEAPSSSACVYRHMPSLSSPSSSSSSSHLSQVPPPTPPLERGEKGKGFWERGRGGRHENQETADTKNPFQFKNIAFLFATFGKPHLGPAPHIWRISSPPPPTSSSSYGWHRRERGKIPLLLLLLLLLLFLPTRERRHQTKSEEEPSLFPPSSPPAKIHKHPVSKYRGECT